MTRWIALRCVLGADCQYQVHLEGPGAYRHIGTFANSEYSERAVLAFNATRHLTDDQLKKIEGQHANDH